MILTNNELAELSEEYGPFSFDIYRAVEQAVIAKLSQGVDIKPIVQYRKYGSTDWFEGPEDSRLTNSLQSRILHTSDAIAASRIKALEDAAVICDKRHHVTTDGAAKAIRALKVLSQPEGE